MPGDYFWNCVESLAVTFDGSAMQAEENLNAYMKQCMAFKPEKRAEVRRQLVRIIGGMAQLESRLADAEAR
jgi:hypothetical protein